MADTTVHVGEQFDVQSVKIDTAIIMVDAATAVRWLTRNVKNRPLNQRIVQRYRSDMTAGRWTMAGDPIRFDTEGHLLDGQHRLTALSETDLTIPLLVVRGLPSESQSVMDQGRKRTAGDQLALRGVKNSMNVAAAVKQYLIWQEGMLFRDTKVASEITSPRIEAWVESHPGSIDAYHGLSTLTRQNDAPPSIAGAAALRFLEIDADAAMQFFTLLARGAGTEGHPIVTLDKRLARQRREGLKMPHRDYLALFILAWNAWRVGKQLLKFQRPRGGRWSEDNFPEPR